MRLLVYGNRPDAATAPVRVDGPPSDHRHSDGPTPNLRDVNDGRPADTGGR